MYSTQPRPYGAVAPSFDALGYLRRVYALFTGGVVFLVLGSLVALYAGEPVVLRNGWDTLAVPPVVAYGIAHPILSMIGFVAAFFAASSLRRTPGVNLAALFGFTFVTGLFAAPALFFAQAMASRGATLSAAPIRDAFLLTGAAFAGLTSYVFVTKRDFSFLGAALSIGVWVLIGASILAMLLGSSALHLAVASVGVLVFAGYILFDTSRLLHAPDDDAVGAALRLFLDVFNMFLFLVQILSSSRRD